MLTCNYCKQKKNADEFYKKGKRLHSYCKPCFNTYCIKRWQDRKQEAVNYKGGKCSQCGYDRCIAALEFHHLNPSEKDFTWVKMRLTSWKRILQELDKCALLCANCHREIHSQA